MSGKCIACGVELEDYAYHNTEAGIVLCQTCSAKISKHYIEGIIANIEADYNVAQTAKELVRRITLELKLCKKVGTA